MSDSTPGAESIAAQLAIGELFNRYCDAMDRKEWKLLDAVFTEDAVADWPTGERSEGRRQIVEFVRRFLGSDEIATHHMVGLPSVELEGDGAEVTVKMRAHHAGVGPREGKFEESLGTFGGRFVRTEQGWRCSRFEERILVMLGSEEVFAPSSGGAD